MPPDIWKNVPTDRARSHERIRAAEGRGSASADFYLALPYRDTTGKDRGQWQMRARSYDYIVRHLPEGGRVLDLGAGNGWMSFRLALAGYQPVAVDLLTNDRDGLGAARHYRARLPRLFPRFQSEMRRLPFADGQFDVAVFNASFHYAEDGQACLREALRCVKTGGMVIISDTPWYARDASGRQMLAERREAFLRVMARPPMPSPALATSPMSACAAWATRCRSAGRCIVHGTACGGQSVRSSRSFVAAASLQGFDFTSPANPPDSRASVHAWRYSASNKRAVQSASSRTARR